jgi:hypothetical protein
MEGKGGRCVGLTSRSPQGLSRAVQGLLYLYHCCTSHELLSNVTIVVRDLMERIIAYFAYNSLRRIHCNCTAFSMKLVSILTHTL